jgi:peptidyl-prolyl cis-trans isomerase B (cyclophilin B)
VVKLHTNFGEITLELNAEKAPITVANFLKYVTDGFFDGLIFHRVIKDFMIQGGGFDTNMKQKSGYESIKKRTMA